MTGNPGPRTTPPGPHELSDSELLDEIAASENPDEVIALRAVAAQRGLRNAALDLPFTERLRIANEQGYVS